MVRFLLREKIMTNAENLPAGFNDSAAAWERALYAFLSEDETTNNNRVREARNQA